MRKLTYITQLFAVMLLLVQLSSCDSMPDPEPISDKYTRPDEVITAGVPIIGGDGTVIYKPTADGFRYAAAMFTNADGTMSAWYTTLGASGAKLPDRTDLNSGDGGGGPYQIAGSGTGAIYYAFEKPFYGWAVFCPGWSKPGNMRMKLFTWNDNYNATISGSPIGTCEWLDYPDSNWNELNTDNSGYDPSKSGTVKFPAGQYLLFMEAVKVDKPNEPGFWGGGRGDIMECWYNGNKLGGNQGFNTDAQYVCPGEVGSSGQVKYVKASASSMHAVWSEKAATAVGPTKDQADTFYAKDPSVVYAGGYYYMTYTGSKTVNEATDNQVFVARSLTQEGPWEKWNGTGWGGNPKAVIAFTGDAEDTFYGAGAASLLVKEGLIYIYYMHNDRVDVASNIKLMTADAADTNWPGTLTDKGVVIDRSAFTGRVMDACQVVYVESLNAFQAVHSVRFDGAGNYAVVWKSTDGVSNWTQDGTLTSNLRVRAQYVRFLTDNQGHITATTPLLLSYQYGVDRPSFMTWMCSYSFSN